MVRSTFAALLVSFLFLDIEVALAADADVEGIYPQLETLYIELHQNPELSDHEERTSGKARAASSTARL